MDNINRIINFIKFNFMGRTRMKTCSISGKKFKLNSENFYKSSTSADGFHPYHKKFDNFRRSTGASVESVRNIIKLAQ